MTDQTIRVRGGRQQARGAKSKRQASRMAEDIIENIDKPQRSFKIRAYELEYLIEQAYLALINHNTISAQQRYFALLSYRG